MDVQTTRPARARRRPLSGLAAVLAATLAAALAAVLTAGCRPALTLPPAAEALPGDPMVVVFVPGITGTELSRPDGGLAWGDGRALLAPRDGGYELALPLDPSDPRGEGLEAGALIEELRLATVARKPIYGPVFEWLVAHGYARGELADPSPGERLFAFAYDWRRDNVDSAQRLADRLEGLREGLGRDRLRVALICQSNGAQICRYLTKYGRAELAEAAAGLRRPPEGIDFAASILVGTANGGSARMLSMLDRGRVYLRLVGRRFLREVFFTMPSVYQDLPAYLPRPFVDERGRPIEADIFDVETWRRFELGIYDPEVSRRLERLGDASLFADAAAREAFLERALTRARELHRVLRLDPPGFEAPPLHLVQNLLQPTAERALLVREDGRWRAYFTGDRRVERDPLLAALLGAPGDGHATLGSQLWLSPAELAALAGEPLYLPGGHFEIILEPLALRSLVEFLRQAQGGAPPRDAR